MKIYAYLIAFCSVLLLTYSQVYGQKKKQEDPKIEVPEFKMDEKTNEVVYKAVVQNSGSKEELYQKALQWFSNFYPNANSVIKIKNPQDGIISGTARFNILNIKDPKTGLETRAGIVMYDIAILFKEGKYKLDINRINWKQSSYYGIEKWIAENKKSYHADFSYYLVQTDNHMKELIQNLKNHMGEQVEEEEDW